MNPKTKERLVWIFFLIACAYLGYTIGRVLIRPFIPDLIEIFRLLQTGDFTGGIFGLQEDSSFVTLLINLAHALGNSVAVY